MGSYTMLWYRQVRYGQPVEYLIKEYEKATQNFEAILKDNLFSLIVSNVGAHDSGTYYCAARHSEARTEHTLTRSLI